MNPQLYSTNLTNIDNPILDQSILRSLMWSTFALVGALLGRNTPQAIQEDTKARLIALGQTIAYKPGQGKSSERTPQDHIKDVIAPKLDPDMTPSAYKQSTYRFPMMENFYGLIKVWKQRGKSLGRIVTA